MHQRHNIRHNMHQAPMMRPPHIPSQINVSIAPHPQQVNMQQPPPQISTAQPSAQQAQSHTQHTNMAIGTGLQIMSQYITTTTTTHQRGDPNRLGHHLAPASQQQQQQQQSQPQQQQQPPPTVTLQQPPLSQPPQRISPQMHSPHYMKTRPPNINNNNLGGVNVNPLQQQHPQLQPPPPTTNINNHQLQHQSHHQPPSHQQKPQQQSQHQLQSIPLQQNNTNNYIQKPNHANKIIGLQSQKYNANTTVVAGNSKVNQSKHSQPHLQSSSQALHQQQPHLQKTYKPQVVSNIVQPQAVQQQSQIQPPSKQQNIQTQVTQHIIQCSSQTITQIANQTQNSQHNIIQNSNKVLNSSPVSNSVVNSTSSTAAATQNCSTSSSSLANSTNSINTQSQSSKSVPIINLSVKSKTTKNSSANISQNTEQQMQSQKINKKQESSNTGSESLSVGNIQSSESNALESVSTESVTVPSTDNISSGKEKTPMCLVNELARYNQIQHQYRLTGEQGPAHSKRFTVILKLGDEEYTAEGLSIKKAQHTAAAEAITKTKYEHPPPKKARHKNGSSRFGIGNITPTVELNALAMKLGERAVYVFDSPVAGPSSLGNLSQGQNLSPINQTSAQTALQLNPNQQIITNGTNSSMPGAPLPNGPPPPPSIPPMPNYYCESNYQCGQFNSRNNLVNIYLNGNGMRFPSIARRPYARGGYMKFRNRMMAPLNGFHPSFHRDACKITLIVGKEKFTGVGPTVQAAKHDAASRALEMLKPIAEASDDNEILNTTSGESESDIKSPISLVYEIGLKRNLLVTFEVKSEVGPPHLKNFITICKVGDITTEGEGNGKKVSKKRAAKKMLEELKNLPPLSPEKQPPVSAFQNNNNNGNKPNTKGNRAHKRNAVANTIPQGSTQPPVTKKRTKNVIKEKPEPESPDEMNPISRLIQIQQALKEREPVYTVIEEKGAPRRREFTIEVIANGQSARGLGSNKKIAKRNAAKNLLIYLGYEPDPNNRENSINIVNTAENVINKVKTSEKDSSQRTNNSNNSNYSKTNQQAQSGSSSRQIVPGLIHLPQNNETINNTQTVIVSTQSQQNPDDDESSQQNSSNEDLSNKNNESNLKSNKESERKSTDFGVRPKDQLLYLAQLLGFEANFTDYPKGNHGEYLTILALFTDPPQLCHGAGENTDASQDNAALAALQMLSKLGLDNVKPKKPQSNNNTSLDDKKCKSTTNDGGNN